MKKVMYTFALLFASASILMAQEDYKMWATELLQPKLDKVETFEKNLAEHNKKFHNEGNKKVSVWYIMSGSNSGKYMTAMGPLTFTDFDSFQHSKAHDDDWNNNVLPYVKTESDFEFWRLRDEYSYVPEGSMTGKEIFRVHDIKPFQYYRFKALMEKIDRVHEEQGGDNYFLVYTSEFESNSHRDVAVSFGLKTWSELDNNSKFSEKYEKVFGDGSWRLFLEEYRACVESYEEELSVYRTDLSGTGE